MRGSRWPRRRVTAPSAAGARGGGVEAGVWQEGRQEGRGRHRSLVSHPSRPFLRLCCFNIKYSLRQRFLDLDYGGHIRGYIGYYLRLMYSSTKTL